MKDTLKEAWKACIYEPLVIIAVLLAFMAIVGGLSCHIQLKSEPDSDVMGGEVEIAESLSGKYEADREVRLPDGTRCDLVNAEYAIEVEYPHKWAESIGQSLYYGIELKKKPAVLFLIKDAKREQKYLQRARTVAEKHGITVYEENIDVQQ